jgi:RimJ/RimL family protein N-acetyltransferase
VPDTLYTARLFLRPWTEEDDELLVTLSARPEMVRFIADGSVFSSERALEIAAQAREHWARHGFGWRVAQARDDGRPVGFAALNFAAEGSGLAVGEYEIGWWIAPEAQGQGLARESAAAVRDDAFTSLEAPSVVARIQPANAASLAVAGAIGLVREANGRTHDGIEIAIFRGTRS